MKRWIIGIFVISLLSAAQADLILLNNGGRLEGKVTVKEEHVQIVLPNGTLTIPRDQIKQIIWAMTNTEVYQQLRSYLDPNDADGHYSLALWCQEHKLDDLYRQTLKLALAADSDHEKSRKALGYERHEGRWITHDESMAKQGYVQHQGQWITQAQRQEIVAQDFQRQLDEERRKREYAEQRLTQAEQRVYALELEISRLVGYVQQLGEELAKPRYVIVHKHWPWPKPVPWNNEVDTKTTKETKGTK